MSTTIEIPASFAEAVANWQNAAIKAAQARIALETANAKAILEAKGSNEAARKAEAVQATANHRFDCELADIHAKALNHIVLWMRGDAFEEAA